MHFFDAGGRTKMKSEEIASKITNALLDLMKEQPYESITITDIVSKAGLSRVTYYRHFSSKEDILIKYFVLTKNRFLQQASLNGGDTSNDLMILNLFLFFKGNMEANKAIRKANLDNELLKFLSTEFLDNLPVKLEKYSAYFIAGGLFNVLINWLENDCKDSLEDVSKPFMYLNKAMPYILEEKKNETK